MRAFSITSLVAVPVTISGTAYLPVGTGRRRRWVKIDPADWSYARHLHWKLSPLGYVVCNTTRHGRTMPASLACFIGNRCRSLADLDRKPPLYFRFKNGDPLDCRRKNLVPDSSCHKDKNYTGAFAKIYIGNRKQWLGRYRTQQEATAATRLAAKWLRAGQVPPGTTTGSKVKDVLTGLASDLITKRIIKPDGRGHKLPRIAKVIKT